MSTIIGPTIREYLAGLEDAVAQLANTWRPDDPAYRADIYRQTLMSLSYSYFAYFHARPEYPDWAPLWNPVYTLQPNPDDIYFYAPIRSDLTYRVSGNRGTVRNLIFVTQYGLCGLNNMYDVSDVNSLDADDFEVGADGEFEILFSAERPANHHGNWGMIGPKANVMFVRFRSWDWVTERDPQISIECLDPLPPKPRLSPDEIIAGILEMAAFPGRAARDFLKMQNDIKAHVGINRFDPVSLLGLTKQVYWPAVFEFDEDEALIVETDLPEVRPYWNIQLNDPYFNAVEYVYRLSSINGATAKLSSDGRFRAVVALSDPGVPNWLDPAGFTQGTIYGRWYSCDSTPTPTLTRVKLADLRNHLPADVPVVTPEERAEQLRTRVRAAQRRRRW
jgi:hypothetical protein